MAVVESKQFIHAPRDEVHQVAQALDDYARWDASAPTMTLAVPENGICVGQQLRVRDRSGFNLVLEYIQVSTQSTSVKMVSGPFFIDRFAGSWLFEDRNGITFARFKYVLTLKKWMLPWLTEYLAGWWLQKQTDQRLLALKTWCESRRSGQPVIFHPASPCSKA